MRERLLAKGIDAAASSHFELSTRFAEAESIPWPASESDELAAGSLRLFAAAVDDRVAVMLSIWNRLGQKSPLPLNHAHLVKSVYEDERFVGKAASGELSQLVLEIDRSIESDAAAGDPEELLSGEQPTLFCYEVIAAHLEQSNHALTNEGPNDGADVEEEADDDEEEALEPIDARVEKMNVRHLFDLVTKHRLDLEPPWQRKDVWSPKKKKELIKSLLLGIPLPSIILHKRGSQRSIIDGKQRLTAIVKFMQNEFKLPNLDVEPEHALYDARLAWFNKDGKKSLPEVLREDLELREIPVLVFEDVPEKRLRKVFQLYNVSGTRLNAAEIRNAVYQNNEIHKVAYVLAGESPEAHDLGTGDYGAQLKFTERLQATLPNTARFAGVAFLSRYLGYSRAAQKDANEPFRLPSTAGAIDRYFDYASLDEDPAEVARELIRVFACAEQFFDLDDDRLPFHRRDDKGRMKFNALVATTNLVASRFLLAALDAGLVTQEQASNACRTVQVDYPLNQQKPTIWDYQARLVIGLQDALQIDPAALPGAQWRSFFRKMAFVRLPDHEEAA